MESSRGSSPSLSPGSLSPSPRADENGARARPLLLNEDIRGPILLGEGSRADRPLLRGRSHNMLTVTHRPLPTNSGSVCQRAIFHKLNTFLHLQPHLVAVHGKHLRQKLVLSQSLDNDKRVFKSLNHTSSLPDPFSHQSTNLTSPPVNQLFTSFNLDMC